jgi:hypothetical protein
MIPTLDYRESQGFRIGHRGCLNRCPRWMLVDDYPILRTIYPLVREMRMLDRAAFAADLLMLGYSCRQIASASQCGHKKILRLRRGMGAMGLLPKTCKCGNFPGHRGRCQWQRELSRASKTAPSRLPGA